MKSFKKSFGLSVILGGFVVLLSLLHAQETENPIQAEGTNVEGMLQAIEATTPQPGSVGMDGNAFYSAQHAPGSEDEWPPLPGDILGLDVWPLGDGYFIVDDLQVDYSALSKTHAKMAGGMHAMDESDPLVPDGDSGTNDYFSQDLIEPDYGTNLWLTITNLSGNAAGLLLSNTLGDIQYEIQGKANLTDTQWISEGFVLGSELTNWTPTSITATNQPTLFLRVRSLIDSDNVGIPDWWQLEYFGYIGIDPNGDPAGDGWSNVQKFQNGMNPNVFYTPPTPQLSVSYNVNNEVATASWQPSPSPVASYTVEEYNSQTQQTVDYTASVGTDEFQQNLSSVSPLFVSYRIKAHYAGGDSAWTARIPVPVADPSSAISLIPGSGNSIYVAATFPPNATGIIISRIDEAGTIYNDPSFNTNFNISVSAFTNGLYLLPAYISATPTDGYGTALYSWQIQYSGVYGYFDYLSTGWDANGGDANDWMVPPYFDGRAELKQNLIFKLRAASIDQPFELQAFNSYFGFFSPNYPSGYVYAGFYTPDDYEFLNNTPGTFNSLLPFEENYIYRNYVFNSADVDSGGNVTTGVSEDEPYYTNLFVVQPPTYEFQTPSGLGATIISLLATNNTQWLCMDPLTLNSAANNTAPIDFSYQFNYGIPANQWTMNSNVKNYWGLPLVSAKVFYLNTSGNPVNGVVSAGSSIYSSSDGLPVYLETLQPQFQTIEYDFWPEMFSSYDQGYNYQTPVPGMNGFAPTNTSGLLITTVGNPNFFVAGYAKLAVLNAYSGVYGYLGQYFTNAYQIDTNGIVTTNTTGILSPYGNFFATQPGPAALVTMSDIDTGQRGTCTVYAVSLNLDANHDGNMDLSFDGTDSTLPSSPFVFWCNNNFDRAHPVDGSDNEQDDVLQGQAGIDQNDFDGNYKVSGNRQIPCARDLEDFSRLWISGVTSNLLAVLPSGSTITLNWGDVGNPNPNNPTIDLFTAADADGGTGYLTNSTIAAQQTNIFQCSYINKLAPGGSIQLNTIQFANNWAGNHFIWCGVTNGSGQLNLTIKDGSGNVLAQASQWIQIVDIKQMYERWTVGDNGNNPPANTVTNARDGLVPGALPFQYASATTNTAYILFVHGWNMPYWEKDRYAETAFKRLYWQGYQGRFGEFRWPTFFNFPFEAFQWQALDINNFDDSELNAWKSGPGLLNLLSTLNTQYPGQVYLMAHSMGNVVAGEALRLAGTNQLVNTYIAMQGAVSAHAYDSTTVNRIISTYPDNYAHYWTNGAPCYFSGSAGAGNYVNFFNTNDYALSINLWQLDQNFKPDAGFGYNFTFNIWQYLLSGLSYTSDRYTIFALCDPSWSYALGAQANVGGVFSGNQVELDVSPYSFGNAHKYHSGEFRSDNAQRWQFWNQTLVQMRLK